MGGRGLAVSFGTTTAESTGGGGGMDALSASLFSKGDFKVTGYGKAEQAHLRKIFGRVISGQELGKMVGAMDGSTVNVTFKASMGGKLAFRVDITHPFISKGAHEGMSRYIFKSGSEVGIYNGTFYTAKGVAPAGFGTRVLANQAYNARQSGVGYIQTFAIGGSPGVNGAYTWGRLGYNAPLSQRTRAALLTQYGKAYRNAKTINELISKGGGEFWRAHAESGTMIFNLSRGSTSLRILNSYTRSKGIQLGRKTPRGK